MTAKRIGMRRTAGLVATALLAGGCAVKDRTVINNAAESHTQLEPAIVDDAQLEGYMQKIGARIVAAAKDREEAGDAPAAHKKGEDTAWMYENVEFHMVGSETLNAFTTGGQHVYIYSELFTTAKTEDEFAAVCAHEFAHIYCRHVQAGMRRQYGVIATGALAAVGGAAAGVALDSDNKTTGALTGAAAGGAAGLAAGQFLGMGFTRGDEDEADKYGFRFYTHAGWDPKQFAGFFQTMIDKGYDSTPEMASDHPKLANRVKSTERRINELPPEAGQWRQPDIKTQSEFERLQALAKKKGEQIAAKQSKDAKAAELMLAAFPSCVAPTSTPQQQTARERIAKATSAK